MPFWDRRSGLGEHKGKAGVARFYRRLGRPAFGVVNLSEAGKEMVVVLLQKANATWCGIIPQDGDEYEVELGSVKGVEPRDSMFPGAVQYICEPIDFDRDHKINIDRRKTS